MKLLFDLFPVMLFFIVFKIAGVFAATAAAIVATFLQVGWMKYRHGRVDAMLWVSLAIITVFGGATLLLHDETFIKWKPTVLYWFFAATLLGAYLLLGKNLMRILLGDRLKLPDAVWRQVNFSWAAFFVVLGILNLYVAYHFSTDAWVNFKLFGATGLTLVFLLLQAWLLAKHLPDDHEQEHP